MHVKADQDGAAEEEEHAVEEAPVHARVDLSAKHILDKDGAEDGAQPGRAQAGANAGFTLSPRPHPYA
jgi:hypothetical protein